MDLPLALLTLAGVHILAVISPGQSFLVTAQTSLAHGRAPAVAVALGQAVGATLWAIAAMLGLALVLTQAAWLYVALRVFGGLYLLYLAVLVWRRAGDPVVVDAAAAAKARSLWHGFLLGFLTLVGNPKAIVFFSSIFVALLPSEIPPWARGAILAIVFVNELVWYTLVASLFSAVQPRAVYLRYKRWIDRVMAVFLALIGGRLVWEARP